MFPLSGVLLSPADDELLSVPLHSVGQWLLTGTMFGGSWSVRSLIVQMCPVSVGVWCLSLRAVSVPLFLPSANILVLLLPMAWGALFEGRITPVFFFL